MDNFDFSPPEPSPSVMHVKLTKPDGTTLEFSGTLAEFHAVLAASNAVEVCKKAHFPNGY